MLLLKSGQMDAVKKAQLYGEQLLEIARIGQLLLKANGQSALLQSIEIALKMGVIRKALFIPIAKRRGA